VAELLGRLAYVPSMGRDLRIATAHALARQEIERHLDTPPAPPPPPTRATKELTASTITPGTDLDALPGITTQTAKALKKAGLFVVGDVVSVPDEHLLKIPGIAERSLAQLRAAIGKATAGQPVA